MTIRLPFHGLFEQSPDPAPKRFRIVRTGIILLLAVSMFGSIIICVLPPQEEPLTEFYILGPEGNADLYLRSSGINESSDMYIGIHNLEHAETLYIVEVFFSTIDPDSMRLAERYNVTLDHGQRSERLVSVSFPNTRYDRLDFLLHKSSVPPESLAGSDRINRSYRNLCLLTTTGVF